MPIKVNNNDVAAKKALSFKHVGQKVERLPCEGDSDYNPKRIQNLLPENYMKGCSTKSTPYVALILWQMLTCQDGARRRKKQA